MQMIIVNYLQKGIKRNSLGQENPLTTCPLADSMSSFVWRAAGHQEGPVGTHSPSHPLCSLSIWPLHFPCAQIRNLEPSAICPFSSLQTSGQEQVLAGQLRTPILFSQFCSHHHGASRCPCRFSLGLLKLPSMSSHPSPFISLRYTFHRAEYQKKSFLKFKPGKAE